MRKSVGRDIWLALRVDHVALDGRGGGRVMSLSPTLGVEPILKKIKEKRKKNVGETQA